MDLELEAVDRNLRLVQDRRRQAAFLVQEGQQQMLDIHLLMIEFGRQALGGTEVPPGIFR